MSNKIIIANWKMKLGIKESLVLAKEFREKFKNFKKQEVVLCPHFIALPEAKKILRGSKMKLGAQDVFWEQSGSFTGEISPDILAEAGCEYVIVGHSERRKYLLENYEMIHKTVKAVLNTDNLTPIVCIGEEASDRKTNKRDFVLVNQLQEALSGVKILSKQKLVVAYEPIWAIGSGIAIEPEEAEYAHKIIKIALNDIFGPQIASENIKIVYGGSVTSKNVAGFKNLENLDGLLVGGASLKAGEFYKIANAILK